MSVDFVWDDHTPDVVIETYSGDWTIDDSRAIWVAERQALDSRNGRINAIIVINDLHLPLSGIRHFSEVSRSPLLSNSRLGLAVLVGLKSSDRPIYDLFIQIYPALAEKMTLAASVDEAREGILARQPSSPA